MSWLSGFERIAVSIWRGWISVCQQNSPCLMKFRILQTLMCGKGKLQPQDTHSIETYHLKQKTILYDNFAYMGACVKYMFSAYLVCEIHTAVHVESYTFSSSFIHTFQFFKPDQVPNFIHAKQMNPMHTCQSPRYPLQVFNKSTQTIFWKLCVTCPRFWETGTENRTTTLGKTRGSLFTICVYQSWKDCSIVNDSVVTMSGMWRHVGKNVSTVRSRNIYKDIVGRS